MVLLTGHIRLVPIWLDEAQSKSFTVPHCIKAVVLSHRVSDPTTVVCDINTVVPSHMKLVPRWLDQAKSKRFTVLSHWVSDPITVVCDTNTVVPGHMELVPRWLDQALHCSPLHKSGRTEPSGQ